MSLRWKALIFVCGVSLAFATMAVVAQRLIIRPGFLLAEESEARDDVKRCVEALRRECAHLTSIASDYAVWDRTIVFLQGEDPNYPAENFLPETFRNLRVNLIMVVARGGGVHFGELRDNSGDEKLQAEGLPDEISHADHPFVSFNDPRDRASGLMVTPAGAMLVGACPITASDGQGAVYGAVIMGRLLDDVAVADLSEQTRVDVTLTPLDAADPRCSASAAQPGRPDDVTIDGSDPDMLRAQAIVRDVRDRPALLMEVGTARAISKRGDAATSLAASLAVAGGGTIMLVMWLLLSRLVVDPLSRVTRHAVAVGANDDLRSRLDMQGQDEVGTLAREFDRMVDRVRASRAQMVDVARHAGMAQVATDVLHNVGNVLNSVNVSAGLVSETLRRSEMPTLDLAAQLLRDHESALDRFFTADDRGRQLPAFLSELAATLNTERESMLREMQNLSDSIEHIRRIVDMQQVHGRSTSMVEPIDPAVLVEQACALSAASFGRHTIRVVNRFDPVGPAPIDRHKTLQILVNLLRNAKQALVESAQQDRCIEIGIARCAVEQGDVLRISVADNGVGIAAEHLTRIFNFGFSTKPDGHGFGLHGAANLASEMGGSLHATSDGPGHGAVFTLELPLAAPVEVKA